MTDDRLPQVVRQSLNVESGLNDGICVPLLLILLATAAGAASHPLRVVAEAIGYGVLCGVGAALLAAAIVVFAGRRRLIDKTWQQIVPLATTIAAYGAATHWVDQGSSPPSWLVLSSVCSLATRWQKRCTSPKRQEWCSTV